MEEKIQRYVIDRKKDIAQIKVEDRDAQIKPTKEFIISIIGPRRAGKTYFLYNFIKKNKLKESSYLFVNFEEFQETLERFLNEHLELYGCLPKYIFLDEIQGLKDWEKELYRIYERKRFFIFITGSSSRLLSKEIATQLRGRGLAVKIFPFSFKEILRIEGLNKRALGSDAIANIKRILRECIYKGCFPAVVLNEVEAPQFISELLDLVIFKDIIERYGVENRVALEFFIKNAIASNSSVFSVNKVYNSAKSLQIKVSKNTLYGFQKFLEDVNVIFFLKKYSKSVRKTEQSLPKAYVVDNALYTYTTYKRDSGILMESFVFQELMKKGYEPNKTLFYFSNGYEVDFVLLGEGRIKQLIQVTYAASKEDINERELKALIKASKLLKCNNLLCITWDLESKEEFKGKQIEFIPLWKWLLTLT